MITLTKKQETELRYLVNKFDIYPQNISRWRLIEVMRDIITDPILKQSKRPEPLRKNINVSMLNALNAVVSVPPIAGYISIKELY